MNPSFPVRILGAAIRPFITSIAKQLAEEIRANRPDEPQMEQDADVVDGALLGRLRTFLMQPEHVRQLFEICKDDLVTALCAELTFNERRAFIRFLMGKALMHCLNPNTPIPPDARYLEAEVARFIARRHHEGGANLVSAYTPCIMHLAQALTQART